MAFQKVIVYVFDVQGPAVAIVNTKVRPILGLSFLYYEELVNKGKLAWNVWQSPSFWAIAEPPNLQNNGDITRKPFLPLCGGADHPDLGIASDTRPWLMNESHVTTTSAHGTNKHGPKA